MREKQCSMVRSSDQDKMFKIDPYKGGKGRVLGGIACVGNK